METEDSVLSVGDLAIEIRAPILRYLDIYDLGAAILSGHVWYSAFKEYQRTILDAAHRNTLSFETWNDAIAWVIVERYQANP
ncbi:hypothetical protein VTK56DRAFT_10147 [Thermocarpiscus australiensis]